MNSPGSHLAAVGWSLERLLTAKKASVVGAQRHPPHTHTFPSPQMEVSADAEHFHIYAQEQKVLQFPHRHRPLATITRVRVLSEHRRARGNPG